LSKKESIRKRLLLASGRRAARSSQPGAATPAAAAAAGVAVAAAVARPRTASGVQPAGGASDHPVPSTTPVKLKKSLPPAMDAPGLSGSGRARDDVGQDGGGGGGGNVEDDTGLAPAVAEASSKWMSKAEEARNRLRRHRRSTSLGDGTELGRVSTSDVDDGTGASDVVVTASVVSGAASSLSAVPVKAVSSKLAKLGSVTGVLSKPRSSNMNLHSKIKPSAAEVAKQAADNAAAFERRGDSGEEPTAPAPPVVHGLDEAEMVLRMGSLASAAQLSKARASVARMIDLLNGVLAASRRLSCEPQNVYGYLLMRIGQPTDAVSAAVSLEDDVGADKVRQMAAATTELRDLLRIKVQDNNDLRLAATALRETSGFFQRLDAAAGQYRVAPHKLLAAQRPNLAGGESRGW